MTLHIYNRVVCDCIRRYRVGRPDRWSWAFRGPGCAVTCNDCNDTRKSRKRTVVSVGHICSSVVVVVVIGSPSASATACHPTDPSCPACPSARLLCDVCVGSSGGLPPCLCIIDVLSNGRSKERKKKYTHRYTRPLRHTAIVTAVAVTILHYCVFTQCTRNHLLCFRISTTHFHGAYQSYTSLVTVLVPFRLKTSSLSLVAVVVSTRTPLSLCRKQPSS